jgi:uncharacterized protein YdaU (DUF1376 family)
VNFYPFHIGDYAAHTRHLSLIEDLAYRRLMDAYYLSEKPLVGSFDAIARHIGMRDYQDEVKYILETFFEAIENGWMNKRADEEIAKYQAKAKSARSANLSRWNKKSDLKSDTDQILTKNQEPITKNHIKNNTPKVVAPEGVNLDLWNEFVAHRKRLRAPVTERVVTRLVKEAGLAKMTMDQVLETIIFKGWRAFEASWIQNSQAIAQKAKELPLGTDKQIEEAYRIECNGDPTKARFNSYFEMKKFVLDQRDKRAKA